MRKAAILLVVFLLMLLAPLAVRYLQYYRPLNPPPATPPAYSAAEITEVPTPQTNQFQDVPAANRAETSELGGIALLDQSHDNQFSLEEIAYLDSLLAARGYQLTPFLEGELGDALRPAGALVIITPLTGYSPAEVLAVREFVARGGRVLLVGDPTRYNIEFDEFDLFAPPTIRTAQVPLNDVANAFDITFRGDYLYNTIENEGNFRNILIDETGFSGAELTDGLEQLALYSSHSLQLGPSAAPVLAGDENTWSSATDQPGGLTLAAVSPVEGEGGQVLALGDLHFLLQPYNTVYDNGEFASRLADFLVANGESAENLAGFPYFFRAPVELIYSGSPELGPDAFDDVVALQAAFRAVGLPLTLAAEPGPERDTLYLGLYNQAEDVIDLLERAGIELVIRPAIQPPATATTESDEPDAAPEGTRLIASSLGDIRMAGSAIIVLDTDGERQQVAVLAASNDGLESALARLRPTGPPDTADFSDCLLQEHIAICPTGIENEPVEYELITTGPGEEAGAPDGGDSAGEEDGGEPTAPIDAADQGQIGIDETKSAELAAEEAHAWTFQGGPATIDIVLDSDDDMDGILELYDPDNQLLANVDSSFAGGIEEMRGIEIPDEGAYTIRVRDFFNDGGNYELSVSAGEPGGSDEAGGTANRVFIFADDDGEPLGEGFTSAEAFAAGLSGSYDVTVWVAGDDGPLPDDALADYQLVIWDSGTYRDEDGLFGDDTGRIIQYLDAGGDLLISGISPTILGPVELAPLENVAIVAGDPALSNGFEDGDVIPLDGVYEAALAEITDSVTNEVIFLARAPGETGEGAAVGVAAIETNAQEQRSIFFFAPLAALPDEARQQLLDNMMAWFGM